MAISLEGLVPEFRTNALALLADLAIRGIEMRPCAALRSPRDQAILWRQSRAREEIEGAALRLRSQGAFFLAETLVSVGASIWSARHQRPARLQLAPVG
jgi:peptidoglycan L-alanyl-D-glutamate endopeptidase CwlK